MHKGHEIIDLPVINLQTGEEIGIIKDVVFDPEQQRLVGLIVNSKSLFQGDRMVSYEELHSVGEDAVTIEDDSSLTKLDETKECLAGATGTVIGSRVVTDDGKELGNIEDIILDPANGQINGYEITDGLVQDILDGRGKLEVSDDLKYGKDVVIVSNLDNYQRITNRDNQEEF